MRICVNFEQKLYWKSPEASLTRGLVEFSSAWKIYSY